MARTPKPQEPTELERAIQAIEAKIDSLQLALAALLDVKDPYRAPTGRPVLETSSDNIARSEGAPPEAPKRSHRRKPATEAPKPAAEGELQL